MNTRWTFAMFTCFEVAATHAIHVSRRPAKIRDVAFKIGHLRHLSCFFHNATLAATSHKLALMSRNGAKRAATKTALVHVDGEFNHVVGLQPLIFIFWMGQTGIRKVEKRIHLIGCHRGIRRIDHHILFTHLLQKPLRMNLV